MIDQEELKMGIKVEKEHTDDISLAKKIAMDHLKEDPRYYTKLKNAGLADELKEDEDDDEVQPEVGEVEPVAASVAIFKIDTPMTVSVCDSGQGQTQLSSSGLGDSGMQKPLKTDKLSSPPEKNKVGPNKIAISKTPSYYGTVDPVNKTVDPLDYFGGQMSEKW